MIGRSHVHREPRHTAALDGKRQNAKSAPSDCAAEQPMLSDLASVGMQVDTVWKLCRVPESRELAIPVLLRHLVLGYPDDVLTGSVPHSLTR